MHESQLKIPWNPNQNWPFCWYCWVPLRQPCGHPPPFPKQPCDPARCPYQVYDLDETKPTLVPIIPRLITIIFGHISTRSDKVQFQEALAKDLGIPASQLAAIPYLKQWLQEPVTKTKDVHNFIRYLLSWYKVTRSSD